MGLRTKNFNVFGVHWKIQLLRGGSSQKIDIQGGLSKKRVLGQFADLRGGWGGGGLGKKEGGGVFEGGDTPMHTMIFMSLKKIFVFK